MFVIRSLNVNTMCSVFPSINKQLTIGKNSLLFYSTYRKTLDCIASVTLFKLLYFKKQKYICSATSKRLASSNVVPPIYVGAKVVVTKTISQSIVKLFAEATGDWNPVHFPSDGSVTARKKSNGSHSTENESRNFINEKEKAPIVHGALLNGIVSGVIGTRLPGPGTVVVSQTLNFPAALPVGSQVEVEVEVTGCKKREVNVQYKVVSCADRVVVMDGVARLMVPKGRISKVS